MGKKSEIADGAPIEALIARAHEMSHRRVVATRELDRFVEEAQPILAALADALERAQRTYDVRQVGASRQFRAPPPRL